MSKVNFGVAICLFLVPSFVVSSVLRDPYIRPFNNNRRVSPFRRDGFFLSGLYNKEGKPHDVGSNFGLTSDVYTKPNPYYTKNANKLSLHPVFNHVFNQSAAQDVSASVTEEVYDTPSMSYDYKTNYPSPSYAEPPSTHDLTSFNVQSVPSAGYGLPSPNYGADVSSYYPHSSFGSQPTYNTPHSSYESSQYGSVHGAPSYYPSSTAMAAKYPEAQKSHSEWFVTKLMKKFDLILMSKILLKLIIFKKIIKFIGVICLLMFLPLLKKKWDGDDEERRIKELDAFANIDFRLKEIVNFAFTSIENFSANNIPWCVGESEFYCRIQYMLDGVDLRYPGSRLLRLWFPKLQTTTTAAPVTTADPDVLFDETITTSTQRNFDEGTVDFNDFITESTEELKSSEESSEKSIEKFNKIFRR